MSDRALFKNAFQQIKRTWAKTDEIDFRLASFDRRILDLEDVAHTPSELESRPPEGKQEAVEPVVDVGEVERLCTTPMNDLTISDLFALSRLTENHLGYKLGRPLEYAIEEIERRIEAAKGAPFEHDDCRSECHPDCPHKIDGRCNYDGEYHAKSAPAPEASEPTSELYVRTARKEHGLVEFDSMGRDYFYDLATPAQVRQAAVGAGLLPDKEAAE